MKGAAPFLFTDEQRENPVPVLRVQVPARPGHSLHPLAAAGQKAGRGEKIPEVLEAAATSPSYYWHYASKGKNGRHDNLPRAGQRKNSLSARIFLPTIEISL
ncbi:hypothetical protein [Moorella stamsii]|uniref:hypothetical protein n=1 Tax=Neomoorella stamsii TaxID=1266720 RepID=UPI000AE31014|nr:MULTISPECIES: hypothetical protein [Moorella]